MIVYRMLDDGGFVAGDTETDRTSYAYPTSTAATQAKRNPVKIAASMMANENDTLCDQTRALVAQDYDARNWVRLNERGGSRFDRKGD